MTDLTPPKQNFQTGGKLQALVPQSFEEAFRMAEAIFVAGMYPDSLKVEFEDFERDNDGKPTTDRKFKFLDRKATASRILIVIQKGMEIGLPPLAALSTIYIVNNRPTVYGDGIPALLYASGKIDGVIREWFTGTYPDADFTAHCAFKRKDTGEEIERTFSMADAKTANLLGKRGPWSEYPKRQLQMRARGFTARDGAADILQGLGIYEEQVDIPTPKPDKVDTSSLDDDPPPAWATTQLSAPDNSNVMPDLSAKREKVPVPALTESLDDNIDQVENELMNLAENFMDGMAKPVTEEETPADECLDCQGRGTVPFKETDEETGEQIEGIQPCPTCKPKP